MYKPEYGDPVVTLRLPRQMITAARICARRNDTTLSGMIRQLIGERLEHEGISWQNAPEPIAGQRDIDDYLVDNAKGYDE